MFVIFSVQLMIKNELVKEKSFPFIAYIVSCILFLYNKRFSLLITQFIDVENKIGNRNVSKKTSHFIYINKPLSMNGKIFFLC